MTTLIVFITYLLVGAIFNYGSAVGVWMYLFHKCKDNRSIYYDAANKHNYHGIKFNVDGPMWLKAVITQVLWPLNTYNTCINAYYAYKEIKTRLKLYREGKETWKIR